MTEELRGTVRKIIFSSDDGRFCVFLLEDKESRKIMTAAYRGPAPYVGQPGMLGTASPFWHAVQVQQSGKCEA